MRISRIHIENFRNFASLDVKLGKHAVIVGENKIGKSNLLYASLIHHCLIRLASSEKRTSGMDLNAH